MMPKEIKPIKRSAALAPLSREHHDGLLFVWKIKEGIKKEIELQRLIRFGEWFWKEDLYNHFEKEEAVLSKVLKDHPMFLQMLAEHTILRKLFNNIHLANNYKDLESLAQILNDHIRFEERQLFNEAEKLASPEELLEILELLKEEKSCGFWEDEFWSKE